VERVRPQLTGHARLVATCDLAVARAHIRGNHSAETTLREIEPAADRGGPSLTLRTRLRIALLGGGRDRERLAHECAAALALEGDAVATLAALIDTTLLLRAAVPALVGPELLDEATHAARQLGNAAAETALRVHQIGAS